MKKRQLMFAVTLLFTGVSQAATTHYEADWASLKTIPVPTWYEDAKFGIFIHWGPYAVPGSTIAGTYSEHYAHHLYERKKGINWHEKNWGQLGDFGYKDYVPMFKAEHFNADEWADIFKNSGAKFVIPVGEHHDGFAMWDSELTTWDAMNKGPKRDIIGELEKSVRKLGMKYGVSFHRERHFNYWNDDARPYLDKETKNNPEAESLYGPYKLDSGFIKDYKARWQEIEKKYKPDFMWIDDAPIFYRQPNHPQIKAYENMFKEMIADFVNTAADDGREVYFNNKGKNLNFPVGVGVRSADNLKLDSIQPKWENPATLGHSYGYSYKEDSEDNYKSVHELINLLVDVVSKNGNLLLNIGPNADGIIPPKQKRRLLGIGQWLKVNGEAIYGTRPWHTFGYDNLRFTTKNNNVYVTDLQPTDESIKIDWSNNNITKVELLGHGKVDWVINKKSLILSSTKTNSDLPKVYRLTLESQLR